MKHTIKSGAILLTIGFLLFVFLGDRFLPEPLGPASLKTRTSLNQAMMGLIPNWRPKTKPYQRTEEAIEKEYEGGN